MFHQNVKYMNVNHLIATANNEGENKNSEQRQRSAASAPFIAVILTFSTKNKPHFGI